MFNSKFDEISTCSMVPEVCGLVCKFIHVSTVKSARNARFGEIDRFFGFRGNFLGRPPKLSGIDACWVSQD